MLEKLDLKKNLTKDEARAILDETDVLLGRLERQCREKKLRVIILFEGYGAAGKGTMISRLIEPLDPRGFTVYATQKETEEDRYYPFLHRFWTMLPPSGRLSILDRSWYRTLMNDRFDRDMSDKEVQNAASEIRDFEKLLTDDGYVLIKFFLAISKKEQKKRFKKLEEQPETAWRVTKDDWKRNKEFERYTALLEESLEATDTEYAPWTIIEAEDKEFSEAKIATHVVHRLQEALEEVKKKEETKAAKAAADAEATVLTEAKLLPGSRESAKLYVDPLRASILQGVDPNKEMSYEEYKEKKSKLQKELAALHGELYLRRIPVILAFEGWDAGGKGGAIKRLTQALDPRGYEVHPVSSPNDIEKQHHYLWRFWTNLPKAGHVEIFDRSWYGRVMVERLEGFCTEDEWKRAYQEMNNMERNWTEYGAVVLKFWMHIDKDEQAKRFKERQENPDKQWKITDEDWRNREKWDQYEIAVDEMLVKTSTTFAPWVIVEANNKYYARIKVLETVVDAIKAKLEEK